MKRVRWHASTKDERDVKRTVRRLSAAERAAYNSFRLALVAEQFSLGSQTPLAAAEEEEAAGVLAEAAGNAVAAGIAPGTSSGAEGAVTTSGA